MRWIRSRSIVAACALLLAVGPAAAAAPRAMAFDSRDFPQLAAAAPMGGGLRLENVQVADTGETAAFVLERFQVFASDARITVHGEEGTEVLPPPANAYFRGAVEDEPGSRVFLAVFPDGRTEGIVTRADEAYLIGGEEASEKALDGPLEMRRVEPVMMKAARGEGFACGNARLPQNQHPLEDLVLNATPAQTSAVTAAGTVQYTARVAVETDYEYYAKFNNTTNATNYAGNLIGYASTIYVNEINTSLVVQSVSLWTTSSDPWTQTSTLCGLMEFGRYWNKNKTGVSRTIAHFLSGRNLGGGIAWLGVLCTGAFGASANCPGMPTDAAWGGGYGFTANISGTFNISSPTVMWDIMGVSHEIGHNFNSPHSHCYNGIGGSSSPIDQCYNAEPSCYSGTTTSLPGPAGAGSGTLMSYCHLVRNSLSDISLNFGTGHPYGVQPGREAARMSGHVTTVANSNPSCLAPVSSGAPAPAVSSAKPSSGLTNANTPVTIIGSAFQSGATVTFGTGSSAVPGGSVVVVSSTTITTIAPPHATGAVRVTVTNPDNQSGYRDDTFFYAPPPVATGFYTLTPCRVVDTRKANGSLGGPAMAANATRTFTVTNVCGIPANAKAISANVTVLAGSAAGVFSLYPGNAFPLGSSTLNFAAGKIRANNAILMLSTDGTGTIGLQNASAGANHVIIDVNGYFQ